MAIVTFADVETTGLSAEKGDKIIEICLIVCDLDTAKGLEVFVQKINPKRAIDAGATAVHGITFQDVSEFEEFREYEPKITEILKKTDLLIIHNAEFDLGFLLHEYDSIKKEVPDVEVFCTVENGRFATFFGKSPTLEELCFAADIEFDSTKAHSAFFDTKMLAKAFFKGYRAGYFKPNIRTN